MSQKKIWFLRISITSCCVKREELKLIFKVRGSSCDHFLRNYEMLKGTRNWRGVGNRYRKQKWHGLSLGNVSLQYDIMPNCVNIAGCQLLAKHLMIESQLCWNDEDSSQFKGSKTSTLLETALNSIINRIYFTGTVCTYYAIFIWFLYFYLCALLGSTDFHSANVIVVFFLNCL